MEWAENFKGLQHIGIPTNDMDKTVEFYKKIGFEVAHETKDGDVRVVFLKLRDLILETYENKEAALCDGAVDHIAFDVVDIEEAYKDSDRNHLPSVLGKRSKILYSARTKFGKT